MQLTPAQKQIIKSKARFKVVACGRGFGKTATAIESLLFTAVSKANRRVAYIGPTIQQTRDIAWKRLLDRTQGFSIKSNKTTLDLDVPTQDKGISTMVLRGWEAIETLRGQEFDMIVIDEIASMRDFWAGWEEVLRPTLRMSQGPVLFIGTPKGFNHFYNLFNTKLESWESFHFTSYDNPYLPVSEIQLAKKQMTENAFEQEYMASFKKTEGLIFKQFNRDIHVKEMPLEGQKMASVDFGYTDPTSILTIYKTSTDVYYVADELYRTQMVEDEIVSYTKGLEATAVYPDPANPMQIEALRRAQVRVRDVVKGKDSIISGINKMQELFTQNKLFISAQCKNLINELEQYSFEQGKQDSPLGGFDHSIDSLRYCIAMTYFRPAYIEPIQDNQPQNPYQYDNRQIDTDDNTPIWRRP